VISVAAAGLYKPDALPVVQPRARVSCRLGHRKAVIIIGWLDKN